MDDDKSKSLDLLGVKPLANTIEFATKTTVKDASKFLHLICQPAAKELGLMLQDQVKHWRAMNAASILRNAEAKLKKFERANVQVHPRLAFEIIDKGSWNDDEAIQGAWAGLLASSCTEDGRDDSNVVFAGLLAQLTGAQVRIINYCVITAPKFVTSNGLPYAESIVLPLIRLVEVTGVNDIQRLDRELNHLRALDLIGAGDSTEAMLMNLKGGFSRHIQNLDATICISNLGLHLYVRAQGFHGSPVEFFGLKDDPAPFPPRPPFRESD